MTECDVALPQDHTLRKSESVTGVVRIWREEDVDGVVIRALGSGGITMSIRLPARLLSEGTSTDVSNAVLSLSSKLTISLLASADMLSGGAGTTSLI